MGTNENESHRVMILQKKKKKKKKNSHTKICLSLDSGKPKSQKHVNYIHGQRCVLCVRIDYA